MISAQHSLHQLLSNYLQGRFFLPEPKPKKGKGEAEEKYLNINEVLLSKKEDLMALGFRDQGGLHGLAIIFNRKERIVLEAGYYIGGNLDGYCLENTGTARQIGPFYGGIQHDT